MRVTKAFYIFAVLTLVFIATGITLTPKYSYDFKDQISIVTAASRMLMDCDYAALTNITDGTEKKRTEDTLEAVKNDGRLYKKLKTESEQIISFEVLEMEVYTNVDYSVVRTKWVLKVPPQKLSQFATTEEKNRPKKENKVFVDYLLKVVDGKWKIVSKKAL